MARPKKQGLDYFPLDTTFDDEIEMLEAVHGNDGFAVWIKLLQTLYRTDNGELDYSDILRRKTLAKRANISEETLSEILETCVRLGLFEWVDEEKTVLASRGVKKRMDKVKEEREKARKRYESTTSNTSAKNPTRNGGNKSIESIESKVEEGEIDSPPPPDFDFDTSGGTYPSLETALTYCRSHNIPEDAARDSWYYYTKSGWKLKNGLSIAHWGLALRDNYKLIHQKQSQSSDARPITREQVVALMSTDPDAMARRRLVKAPSGDTLFLLKTTPLPNGFQEVTT